MALSYIDYEVGQGGVTPSTTAFDYNFNVSISDHIVVQHRLDGETAFTTETDFAITGTDGAWDITLGATFPTRSNGDIVRIKRVTPSTKAGRLVTFQAGTLTADDLNAAYLQLLFAAEERLDDFNERTLALSATDETNWAAGLKRITGLGGGSAGSDAATVSQLTEIVTGSGAVPTPLAGQSNYFFSINAGSTAWEVSSPADSRTKMGLGTVATLNTGTGAGDIPTITIANSAYLQTGNDLSDVDDADTARNNLGIPLAAANPAALLSTTDEGVAASRVVELDASAYYPNADGRNIDLSNNDVASRRWDTVAQFFIDGAPYTVPSQTLTKIPLAAITASVWNSDSDITVDTTNDRFTLKGGGAYIIEIGVSWNNQSVTREVTLDWNLYNFTDTAVAASLPSLDVHRDDGASFDRYIKRNVIVSPSSDTTYEIRMAQNEVTPFDLRINDLEIMIYHVI